MPFKEKPAEEQDLKDEIVDLIGEPVKPQEEEEKEEKKEKKEETEEEKKAKAKKEEEEKKKKAEEEEEEEEDEEEEEEEESAEDTLSRELKEKEDKVLELQDELSNLKGKVEGLTTVQKKEEEKPELEKREDVDYISAEETESLLSEDGTLNREGLNSLMNKVANAATINALKMIPQVVSRQVTEATTNKQIIEDFYRENDSLNAHRSYVGYISNQLSAQNPDWDLKKLLSETASKVRAELKISDEASEKEKERRKPKSPRKPKGGGDKEVPKLGELQEEIDDLISSSD